MPKGVCAVPAFKGRLRKGLSTPPMGILEKLRPLPRWKHADPAVRAASVYDLASDNVEALVALARDDAEARVRRAAVTRVGDPVVLSDVARTDPDEDVRAEAIRGLAGLAAEADDPALACEIVRHLLVLGRVKEVALIAREGLTAAVRREVVDLVDDQKSLGAISRHARDAATRLRALARLADPQEIVGVALKCEHTDAAVAALERVSAADALDQVAQRARSKVAARRARARLRLLAESARPAPVEVVARMRAEDVDRATALVHRAEALVAIPEPDVAAAALAETRLAWAEFQADVDAIDAERLQQFETASEAVREAIAERQQERAAELQRADAMAREQRDRDAICAEIEGLSGHDALDRIAELKVRWDALAPMPSLYAASLSRRFQDGCRAFEDRERRRTLAEAASGRLDTLATELEQLLACDQPLDEVVARWRGLRRDADVLREHAEANPSAAERLNRTVAILEEKEHLHQEARAKQEQDNLKRLQQLCRQVEALAASVDPITLKAGDRALRDIREAIDARVSLPSKKDRQDLQGRLEAARARLGPRVQELRDADEWQRWANLQVQEELCREMEALKGDPNLDAATRRMRELQGRWKAVALAPRAQGEAMWRRFQAAQGEVYGRTAALMSAQNEERLANLSKKQELSARAEALSESMEWVKTATAIQALQAEWKTVGPVTRGHERVLWERFRGACDRFFTRRHEDLKKRKEDWSVNLARKDSLCEKAEALATSTEWDSAAAQIKELQAEWKRIGAVRRSQSEVVWQRFRTACDRFFDRYKYRDQVDLVGKAAPREEIIRGLEALLPSGSGASAAAEAAAEPRTSAEGLVEAIHDARARWQQAPELPRPIQQDFAARYHQVLGRLVAAWPAAFAGTDLDPEHTRKRMEKLVVRVEEILDAQPVPPRALSPTELLAQQWRERLAANTITGSHAAADTSDSRWRGAEQEIRNAQAQWARFGPVPADVAGPLHERFQRACRLFFDKRPRSSTGGTSA
jgi:hypothetical protein